MVIVEHSIDPKSAIAEFLADFCGEQFLSRHPLGFLVVEKQL
jgi:hypothetical protein